MNNEDYEIEDLIDNLGKKERKKNTSKRKGNTGERELAKILCERFPGRQFFRVLGSGNRWSQVELTEETRGAFTGDLVCPSNFSFCLECKYGYSDYELCGFFTNGHKDIDEWLKKAKRDADSLGKMPMLCWRKPRYEWLAFIPLLEERIYPSGSEVILLYKGWMVASLKKWLEKSDDFWFKELSSPNETGEPTGSPV